MVVLHKIRFEAAFRKRLFVPAFQEEATRIAEHLGFKDKDAGEGSFDYVHFGGGVSGEW